MTASRAFEGQSGLDPHVAGGGHVLSRADVFLDAAGFAVTGIAIVVLIWAGWPLPALLLLAVTAHRATRFAQLRHAARRDAKTGLLNPAAWSDLARRALARADRQRQPAALLLLDLDRFKAINDQHGHLAGDRVLHAVSQCTHMALRGYDAIGRWGGEELVAVIDNADAAHALAITDRLLCQIRELRLDHPAAVVTASAGIAVYPDHGRDLHELIGAADAALYRAKAAGRDQAKLAAPTQPSVAAADVNSLDCRPAHPITREVRQ
jgi:diguanylate cyclase (GGDEF)-like protein